MRAFLILIVALVTVLFGCKVSEMDENKFWSIIEASKGVGGESAHAERLEWHLHRLPADQIEAFDRFYRQFHDKANSGPVWAAGMLLNHGHASDDGFEYFRNWLIAQGRSTYEKALADPDSLVAVPVQMNSHGPEAEWERYGYATVEAYERLTGKSLPERSDKQDGENGVSFDWQEYTDEVLSKRLPNLWKKYGEFKKAADVAEQRRLEQQQRDAVITAYVDGLGTLNVGGQIEHRKFGMGTIKFIDASGMYVTARIVFGNDERNMAMLPDSELWRLPK